MKVFGKILLAGTVAVMAMAVSSAPSEAAKKKAAKASGCAIGATCQRSDGVKMRCEGDKWTPMLGLPCLDKSCAAPC